MAGGSGAPPWVAPLPGWRAPLQILRAFPDARMPALLTSSGPPGAPPDVARWSILCMDPFETVRWSRGDPGDPFDLLEKALAPHACAAAGEIPFAGGAVGYVGYEAGHAVEPIGPGRGPSGGLDTPDLLFGLYARAIVWDHHRGRWFAVCSGAPDGGASRARRAREEADRLAAALARLPASGSDGAEAGRGETPRERSVPVLGSSLPERDYVDRVREARRLIEAGDLYQVNLSQRLELPEPASPIDLAEALGRTSPVPFAAYLDAGPFRIVSASPERFVRLAGGRAECRPIKGTRPRGKTPAEDARLRDELIGSAKDRAENVMIADLVRNDLGRVCAPGTVRCDELFRCESYASVHHLVSIVSGRLREGASRADLLRALYPCGSMTGAPKVAAMRAIDRLEPVPRGVYSGALGYLSFCGGADLSVVIRTLVLARGRSWLHVGGGVVADSDPVSEHRESLDKAESVVKGLAITAWREPLPPAAGTSSRPSAR